MFYDYETALIDKDNESLSELCHASFFTDLQKLPEVKYQKWKGAWVKAYDSNTIVLTASELTAQYFNPLTTSLQMNLIHHNNMPVQLFIEPDNEYVTLLTAVHLAISHK